MIRAGGELYALALDAARGACVPPGQSEDFARVLINMAGWNPDALAEAVRALEQPLPTIAAGTDGGTLVLAPGRVVLCAPMAIDALRAGAERVRIAEVDAPALLAAYLALAGLDFGLVTRLRHNGAASEITLSRKANVPAPPPPGPVTVPDAVWQGLSVLAKRTYVPASAASRLAGAGAGLNDND